MTPRRVAALLGWCTVSGVIGLFLGMWLESREVLALKKDVSTGQFVNAILGVVLTVTITRAAGQLSDRRKHYVAIVMPTVDSIFEALKEIESAFEGALAKPMTLQRGRGIVAVFRRANNSAELVRKQLEILEFGTQHDALCSRLREQVAYLRDQATRESFPIEGFQPTIAQFNALHRECEEIRLQLTRIARALAL